MQTETQDSQTQRKFWFQDAKGMLMVREAAALYDLEYFAVMAHIKRGTLPSTKLENGRVMVWPSDMRKLVNRLAKRRKNNHRN